MASSYKPVPELFSNRSVFITGGSGFLGKVLLEKLLRSCSGVKKVYLLLRPKKGASVEKRLQDLLETQLFNTLRKEQPNFHEKISAVTGDICEPDLGLSEMDRRTLVEEVSIVFHSAATVRFEEKMKLAIQLNIEGCAKILHLSKSMKHLDALVHVSTAYGNCDKRRIEEVIYCPQLLPQKLLDAAEWMDEDILDQLTPRLLGDKPNTYTYTKQLAEYLLAEGCDGVPLTIVRPSIVGGSWVEPVAGWVDNFNGPTGLLSGAGKGLMRSMLGDREAVADIVPVDIVVNLLVVAAWRMATQRPDNIPVYNCTSGQMNRISWGQFERLATESMTKNPLDNVIRLPNPQMTKNALWHTLKLVFDQQLPCLLLDLWRYVTGKKTFFCRINKQLARSVESLNYFTSHEWDFSNDNLLNLLEQLSPADRKDFNFDVRCLNWRQYVENYCLGMKTYALKEDVQNLSSARFRIKQLQRMSFLFNMVLAIVVWRLVVVRRVKVAHTMWHVMLNLTSSLFQRVPRIARS